MSSYSSMNSPPTDSISFDHWESPRSDLSSSFENSICTMNKWKRTPEKRVSLDEYDEYGQVEDLESDEPFVIKFDKIVGGQVVCQLDDFLEVPLSEASSCLDCLTDQRISANSVEIEINICQPHLKIPIENVILDFVERRERRTSVPITRFVFYIYDFSYAKEAASIAARLAPRAIELNIGIAKRNVYPLTPPQESRYVGEFLNTYLESRESCDDLHVIRVYNFISLDPEMEHILKKCRRLRHLTLSNIDDIESSFRLPSVESVLLDSCHYSITMLEESFADKHPKLFPNATIFGFLRSPVDLAYRALRQWTMEKVAEKRKELCFYQPDRDFRRFLELAKQNFEVVNEEKELEGEIQIRGRENGPIITVFNKERRFKTSSENY